MDLRAVKLVLTAGCNLRCSYCYQSDKKNLSIDWEVVRSALDRLMASARCDVEVLFIGGEPLMEFPTIERAVAYIADHKRPDMRVRYSIITNGLLVGEREIGFFVKHGFHVQLSFDGLPQAQLLRGPNTFDRLDGLLDSLRDRHPAFFDRQLRVNITLTTSTLAALPDSVEYFLFDKRVQDLTITPQMTTALGWRKERIDELDQIFARIFRASLRRYRETGEVPLEIFRKKGPRQATRRPKEMSMCGVGRGDQVAVDVDGSAQGCLMFVPSYQTFPTVFLKSRVEALRLGDVRDPTFDDRLKVYPDAVRAAEIFSHKEQKYSSYGICGECKYMSECAVCPMSIGRVEGEDDPRRVPDFNCAYNLVSLKYRARFPRMKAVSELIGGSQQTPLWRLLVPRRPRREDERGSIRRTTRGTRTPALR